MTAVSEKSALVTGHVTRRGEPGPSRYGAIKDDHRTCRPPVQPSFYLTCRDCVIVAVVVGIAIAAIVVSLALGLPALEAKRRELLNETLVDQIETTTQLLLDNTATAAGS